MAEAVLSKEPYSFVVAIDVGTAHTKVAWARKKGDSWEQVHHFDKWPHARNRDRVPTAVLYRYQPAGKESWEFEAFGQNALNRFHSEGHNMALFRAFKMSLHEMENFGVEMKITSSNIPTGFKSVVSCTALNIFTSILRELSTMLLSHFKKTYKVQSLRIQDIKWVLTVPALWKASARNFMREAAKEAGLYNKAKPRQLALALEPECAALFVRELDNEDLLLGESSIAKKYIVVDIGAGTVDIAVHEVIEHKDSKHEYVHVHELEGCIGNAKGAKTIDDAFERFMKDLPVKKFPNFFSPDVVYHIWDKLMNNFQVAKEDYNAEGYMKVEIPDDYFSRYKDRVGKGLRQALSKSTSPQAFIMDQSSRYLFIPQRLCLPWFNSTCDNVLSTVTDLSKKYTIETVFLVGGFADCEILLKAFGSSDTGLDPVIPNNPGLAVVKGAVKYGPIPRAIVSRRSYSTYGVAANTKFVDNEHDKGKRYWNSFKKAYYCKDIFSMFVHKGQELDPSKPYKRTYYPLTAEQTEIAFKVFASDSTSPKYVTDITCHEIGFVSVDIKPLAKNADKDTDNREVEVVMDFSGPEIFVVATDKTDGIIGDVSDCTLDFLPVQKYIKRK